MQAVILAAGMGSRLNTMTGGGSKALVQIGGRPLILHTLEALADHGIGPVLVIVGHESDKLYEVIGDRAEVLLNERFAETNSLYSLWLARDWVKGPLLLLNCDLFFDPRILDSPRCASVVWNHQTPSSRLALLAPPRFHSVGQLGRRAS